MLTTARTRLRSLELADAERQHVFDQDTELYVLDCRLPVPASYQRAVEFVEQRHEDQRDVARFAVEADGQYIGHCSLSGLRDPQGNLELGIFIGDREYWSRSYGREAIGCLLHYGFTSLGRRRIALTTHEDNPRALRCYLACGFVEEGRPRQVFWTGRRFADLVEMSILREEWIEATAAGSRLDELD